MIYRKNNPLKPLLLVHLLWQMQFLRRRFVVQKIIHESLKNSLIMCWSDADAFIV